MAVYIVWFIGLSSSFLLSHGVHKVEASHYSNLNLQSLQSMSTFQPYRTGFHFQPTRNWMNDPNGPMIYKGIYHLFYQYNPFGADWGNIVWGHSTSIDLVNWVQHDNAINGSAPFDKNGCWSGSVTILPREKPVILYTGVDEQHHQVQNLALPKNLSDPFLIQWIKPTQNPVMTPIDGINASSFRDPTTAWRGSDGKWRVIIGSMRGGRGIAILYRSKDFIHWIKSQHPLHSAKSTGMWECPDFFPVSVISTNGVDTSEISPTLKYVLKLSLDDTKNDYYTIGTYYHDKDKYIPDPGSVENDLGLRYDYGKFYASKSFFDSANNRRILWAWINETDNAASVSNYDKKKGWSGIQSIPRSIWLDKTGKQLVQWPIVEIEKLRGNRVDWFRKELKGGSIHQVSGVTASQGDVEISFELSKLEKVEIMDTSWVNPRVLCSKKGASIKGGLGPFGLLVLASKDLQEQTAVFFRVFKGHNKYVVLLCSDQSRSSLGQKGQEPGKTTYGAFVDVDPFLEQLSLRSLIDHSVVESFGGGGKTCMTARVYPKLAIDNEARLFVFNNGTEGVRISKMSAWSMKKAQIK